MPVLLSALRNRIKNKLSVLLLRVQHWLSFFWCPLRCCRWEAGGPTVHPDRTTLNVLPTSSLLRGDATCFESRLQAVQAGESRLRTVGSWKAPFRFLECIGTMNRILLVLVLEAMSSDRRRDEWAVHGEPSRNVFRRRFVSSAQSRRSVSSRETSCADCSGSPDRTPGATRAWRRGRPWRTAFP